jgi:hypothetical protein
MCIGRHAGDDVGGGPAAEGRDDEAEGLYRSALDNVTSGYAILSW